MCAHVIIISVFNIIYFWMYTSLKTFFLFISWASHNVINNLACLFLLSWFVGVHIEHLLGGWWETCSATNDTLPRLQNGTGPSDTGSCPKITCVWEKPLFKVLCCVHMLSRGSTTGYYCRVEPVNVAMVNWQDIASIWIDDTVKSWSSNYHGNLYTCGC